MSEPTKLEPGEIARFDQPDWEQRFDKRFDDTFWAEVATEAHFGDVDVRSIKQFIRELLREQRLADSIEPEPTLDETGD